MARGAGEGGAERPGEHLGVAFLLAQVGAHATERRRTRPDRWPVTRRTAVRYDGPYDGHCRDRDPTAPSRRLGVSARPTVLVVEDDEGSRELLALALSDHGLRVELAGDGAEALERLESGRPDLIVLDFRMPSLDGAGFMRWLQVRPGPRPPVLLLTAAPRPA